MVSIGGQRLEVPPIPPGIRLLMTVNAAVFVLNVFLGGRLCDWFGLSWHALVEFYGLGVLRFLTSQFTHSYGDPMHLIGNMISLYVFGGIVEEFMGKTRTIRLYLWCGFVGGVVELLFAPVFKLDVPMVGASGACFGLMLYAACLAPNRRIILILVQIPLWLLAALFSFLALYSLHLEFVLGRHTGVADGAHVGGAMWGALCWKLDRTRTFLDSWRGGFRRWRQGRERDRAEQHEASLDQVLTKVKQEGIASLTGSERRVLERASKELRSR